MARVDKWAQAKHEYVTTDATLEEIANKFEISSSQVRKRAAAEKWKDARNKFRTQTEQKTVEKTCERISDDRSEINARHYAAWGKVIEKLQLRLEAALDLGEIDTLTKSLERAQKGQRLAKDMVTDKTAQEVAGASGGPIAVELRGLSDDDLDALESIALRAAGLGGDQG